MTKAARIHLLVVSTLLVFLLAACGSSSADATSAPPATAETPPTTEPTVASEATLPPTVAATEVPEASADHPASIIVAVNAEFKPFVFMDEQGKMVGFDLDLMNALSSAGNFELGFEDRPFEGMIDAVAAGEYDAAISGITITDERKQKVDFTTPYFQPGQSLVSYSSSGQGLAVRMDETAITSTVSLTAGVAASVNGGVKVGVKRSTTGDDYVSALNGVTVVRFDEASQALEALVNGEVDAVVVDIAVMTELIKRSQGAVKLVGGLVTQEEYAIAVNKDRANVREMLDAALAQIREDGTYDQIFTKWFGAP